MTIAFDGEKQSIELQCPDGQWWFPEHFQILRALDQFLIAETEYTANTKREPELVTDPDLVRQFNREVKLREVQEAERERRHSDDESEDV